MGFQHKITRDFLYFDPHPLPLLNHAILKSLTLDLRIKIKNHGPRYTLSVSRVILFCKLALPIDKNTNTRVTRDFILQPCIIQWEIAGSLAKKMRNFLILF